METLSTSIDQEAVHLWFVILVELNHLMNHGVDPSASLHVIKSCNNDVKLLIKILGEILNRIGVIFDFDTWAAFHHELSSHFGFVLFHVFFAEQELAI